MSKITMTRRATLAGIAGLGAMALLPGRALAVTAAQAEALIDKVVRDINKIIASGKSERAMIRDFEKVFVNYADVGRIAMMVLGPDGRAASASQKRAFTKAFQGYVGRKYGKRFREFIGGRVEVQKSRAVKSFFEVTTMTKLSGHAPFEVIFVVSAKSGRFIDMKIEGISLVKSEREEVGAMLDRRRGDLNKLAKDLKSAG